MPTVAIHTSIERLALGLEWTLLLNDPRADKGDFVGERMRHANFGFGDGGAGFRRSAAVWEQLLNRLGRSWIRAYKLRTVQNAFCSASVPRPSKPDQ
jgi:hypothetical protein